jgi:arylsulfatase A
MPVIRFAPLFLLVSMAWVEQATAAGPARPNIVFILADDQGWTDIGCYGSTFYQTPNLDGLARRGMRFTRAYAACCVCSPTRASIMTGKYPARLGLTDWLPGQPPRPTQMLAGPPLPDHLSLDELTVAEALKAGGYATGFIGKWHLGGAGFEPDQQGFDLNIGGCQMGQPPSYFSPYHIPTMTDGPKGQYLTDRLTDDALSFIDRNKGRPFFLYLAHYAVHIPLQAKAPDVARYRARAADLPPRLGPEFALDHGSRVRQRQDQPVYAAMVDSLDQSVGRVVAKLDALGLSGNTIILFTSDNGGLSTAEGSPTSNVPLRGGKGWPYEGGVREPLIAVWPGVIKPGSECGDPMISTDYYPTLLAAAGLPPRPEQHRDGQNILPLFKGESMPPRTLFWHYPHYSNQDQTDGPNGTVMAGDHKLIQWYQDMRCELYDLAADPGEHHDLAAQQPERAAALRTQLDDWRRSVGARMPTPNPRYRPHGQPPAAGVPLPVGWVVDGRPATPMDGLDD